MNKLAPSLWLALFSATSIFAQVQTTATSQLQTTGQQTQQPISCITEVTPEQAALENSRDREQYNLMLNSLIANPAEDTKEFLIQLHFLREDNGTNSGNVATAAQIRSEIANYVNPYFNTPTLNAQFVECGPELYHNSTAYNSLSSYAEGANMSAAYNVANVINIYFVEYAQGACGWARFPANLPEDYIVILYDCGTNQSTLVHELGHYFDLYHTHETYFGAENVTRNNADACYDCDVDGDLLCDTEADPNISGNVYSNTCAFASSNGNDFCGVAYTPDPNNIMSYSAKPCRTVFTLGQQARMAAAMNSSRSYLMDEGCPSLCNISSITAGTQTPCSNGTYTQEITVTYSSDPGTGTLDVNGQSFSITTSPQTVTLTNLTADGNPVNVSASFSAEPTCSLSVNTLFTAPINCTPPTNDLCADALSIACGATVSGNTTYATFDNVGTCNTTNTSAGIWYKFTATSTLAELSTCNQANFDTKISVFSGSCGTLVCTGGNDDTPGCSGFSTTVHVPTSIGTTYYVLVHGFGTATGAFNLSLNCLTQTVPNDFCSGAISLACNASVQGTTVGATPDFGGGCSNFSASPNGVWYKFVAQGPTATVSTCSPNTNYDTRLTVFSGDCSSRSCLATSDDDPSCTNSNLYTTVTLNTNVGDTYYVLVHGFQNLSGNFEVSLDCASPCAATSSFKLYGLNNLWENAGANDPNLFYQGITQWKRVRANAAGGVGPYTYTWSNSEGYTLKNQSADGRTIWMFEPQGPSWNICEITDVGANCTFKDSVFVDFSDEYYCGTSSNPWMLKMCLNGVSTCMPWSQAKAALKNNTATLGYCSPTKKEIDAIVNFTVYPNPTNGLVKVEFNLNQGAVAQLVVMDVNGRLLLSKSVTASQYSTMTELDLSHFSNGMYFVKLISDQGVQTEKIQLIN